MQRPLRGEGLYCQFGYCPWNMVLSRFRVGGSHACLWHFADAWMQETSGLDDLTGLQIEVFTKRRPWDGMIIRLRIRQLRHRGVC
jgi:hypothetical protein